MILEDVVAKEQFGGYYRDNNITTPTEKIAKLRADGYYRYPW